MQSQSFRQSSSSKLSAASFSHEQMSKTDWIDKVLEDDWIDLENQAEDEDWLRDFHYDRNDPVNKARRKAIRAQDRAMMAQMHDPTINPTIRGPAPGYRPTKSSITIRPLKQMASLDKYDQIFSAVTNSSEPVDVAFNRVTAGRSGRRSRSRKLVPCRMGLVRNSKNRCINPAPYKACPPGWSRGSRNRCKRNCKRLSKTGRCSKNVPSIAYRTLGVKKGSTHKSIRAAYRGLKKSLNPGSRTSKTVRAAYKRISQSWKPRRAPFKVKPGGFLNIK